jgi:hypothetical protein
MSVVIPQATRSTSSSADLAPPRAVQHADKGTPPDSPLRQIMTPPAQHLRWRPISE